MSHLSYLSIEKDLSLNGNKWQSPPHCVCVCVTLFHSAAALEQCHGSGCVSQMVMLQYDFMTHSL